MKSFGNNLGAALCLVGALQGCSKPTSCEVQSKIKPVKTPEITVTELQVELPYKISAESVSLETTRNNIDKIINIPGAAKINYYQNDSSNVIDIQSNTQTIQQGCRTDIVRILQSSLKAQQLNNPEKNRMHDFSQYEGIDNLFIPNPIWNENTTDQDVIHLLKQSPKCKSENLNIKIGLRAFPDTFKNISVVLPDSKDNRQEELLRRDIMTYLRAKNIFESSILTEDRERKPDDFVVQYIPKKEGMNK